MCSCLSRGTRFAPLRATRRMRGVVQRGGIIAAVTSNLASRLIVRFWQGPPHQVDRVLREVDEVAGFRVIHALGHSRGEVIYFRDSDSVDEPPVPSREERSDKAPRSLSSRY